MPAGRKDPGLANEERQCLLGALAGFSGKEFGWGGAACTYWSAPVLKLSHGNSWEILNSMGKLFPTWSVWSMEIYWKNLQAWRVWWFWSQVDRKEGNAIVWFTQHLDMPEWEDQDIVNKEEADTWIGNNWEKSLQCRCIWMLLKFQLQSQNVW